jgi:hypothetical protein
MLQLYDNALVAAGLVDDSRTMLPRLQALLELAVQTPLSNKEASQTQ